MQGHVALGGATSLGQLWANFASELAGHSEAHPTIAMEGLGPAAPTVGVLELRDAVGSVEVMLGISRE
ncbi:hypothetical protein SAMD00023353_4000600 [Rosellinia necatrix]|uniref:Uncharacterized protein n=1 Tax=Rosellinia necatrix TaxID=77044 RepID=A0A1S8A948_ROSNE|nr:hypothetical protein SAMD00023353_4000600 [Rosellinia necatrix]